MSGFYPYKAFKFLAFLLILCSCFCVSIQVYAQESSYLTDESQLKAEKLWCLVEQDQIKAKIKSATKLSDTQATVIFSFLRPHFFEDLTALAAVAGKTSMDAGSTNEFIMQKLATYLAQYDNFQNHEILRKKTDSPSHSLSAIHGINAFKSRVTPLGVNEPCTNIDFEEGTTRGWQGWTGRASILPEPSDLIAGFVDSVHTIMTAADGHDPYVGESLPVVLCCPPQIGLQAKV